MEIEIGRGKKARQAYGFDDIAIVPSRRTRDPQDVDIGWKLGAHLLELPLLASAMDGVVSPQIAIELGQLGGLGVLNLEGIFTRFQHADRELEKIAKLPKEKATAGLQKIYEKPVDPRLISARSIGTRTSGSSRSTTTPFSTAIRPSSMCGMPSGPISARMRPVSGRSISY